VSAPVSPPALSGCANGARQNTRILTISMPCTSRRALRRRREQGPENDRVYRPNDMVDYELGLRLTGSPRRRSRLWMTAEWSTPRRCARDPSPGAPSASRPDLTMLTQRKKTRTRLFPGAGCWPVWRVLVPGLRAARVVSWWSLPGLEPSGSNLALAPLVMVLGPTTLASGNSNARPRCLTASPRRCGGQRVRFDRPWASSWSCFSSAPSAPDRWSS